MKKVFLFAAIAALFAACSSKDELVKDDTTQQPQLEKGAIGFDVYTQKATTRAGWAGSLTTERLKNNSDPSDPLYSSANGFGVFGYYTDNNEYEQRSVPNFMYNQQVTWNITSWEYNPVVYWPNEYGDKAISDDQDKLTFFAYAPYVKVIPTSGKLARTTTDPDADDTKELESYGITGMTRNTTAGDPILKYIASFRADKSVDLCWGVADNNDGSTWDLTQTGTSQSPEIANGKPWLNVERPANVDQRIRFNFKHALAQMKINIDADVDIDGRDHTKPVTNKTRVWVRQITFKGFALKGSLNLNNDDAYQPKWLDYNGQNELVAEDVTIYDGRKDGKEGVNGAIATNEKTLGLNPILIQDGVYEKGAGSSLYDVTQDVVVYGVNSSGLKQASTDWERKGVTNQAVNLFAQADDNKNTTAIAGDGDVFHVIPVNENFEVEIVYDIETVDGNLAQNLSDGATKGSSIENRIRKTINFGSESQLKAGHSYSLNLHLGMNSVKFDAAVTEWKDVSAQDVDLPLNVPAFTAGSSSNTVNLPYIGDYTFAITGLNGGESMTNEAVSNIVMGNGSDVAATTTSTTYIKGNKPVDGMTSWSATSNNANTSGVAIQTMTIYPNDNTIDRTQVAKWTGAQSGSVTTITFVQAAHPLYLKITGFANNGSNGQITLARYNDNEHVKYSHWGSKYGWFCDENGKELDDNSGSNYIKVWRNGTLLTWAATTPTANTYTFANAGQSDNYTNYITIGDRLQAGDVIKVELKTGDAPKETVTATVGGIFYSPATKTIPYRTAAYEFKPTHVGEGDLSATLAGNDDDVATVSAFNVTTQKKGSVTITAESTNALDAVKKATLTLTVVEQNSVIKGFVNQSVSKSKAGGEVDANDVIVSDLSLGVTFNGTEDCDLSTSAGSAPTYSIVSVKKGDSTLDNSVFAISTNALNVGSAAALEVGEYKVTVKATGTGTTGKFKNAEKDAVITVTVTT